MPTRLVQVTIYNNSKYPIVWQDDGRLHGFWQDPWWPSNIKNLTPGNQASFRLESGGIATGVNGWALFKIDVPFDEGWGPRPEFFRLDFSRAFFETETFSGGISPYLKDPRTNDPDHTGPILAYVVDHGFRDLDAAGYSISNTELLGAIGTSVYLPGVGMVAEAVPELINESIPKHVWWIVEVRNTGEGATAASPITIALTPQKGYIYNVTRRVLTLASTLGAQSQASGGDLRWYRHDGRLDGSVNWEGGNNVGARWDGLKHLFCGGDEIIYAVTPRSALHLEGTGVASTLKPSDLAVAPASGGDLLWYRHVGQVDGTFKWEGPKKVGARWDVFKHVFSGGDGVVYGIQENGDLMWYRHIGHLNGDCIWEGPCKVGGGWGNMQHVFYGGDGIIYAVTPSVPATPQITGGVLPASGGDLLWFRHLGRDDGSYNWQGPKKVGTGWGSLERVLSDGAGVIYGVTPAVDASFSLNSASSFSPGVHSQASFTPASGGKLMWFRHLGRDQGTMEWEGPKEVGSGWSGLEQLFSGGVTI